MDNLLEQLFKGRRNKNIPSLVPEVWQVPFDYYAQACSGGLPPELRSPQIAHFRLVDYTGADLGKKQVGHPLIATCEYQPLAAILQQKPGTVAQELEGVIPCLNPFPEKGKDPKRPDSWIGFPVVLQLLEGTSPQRFKLLSVQGSSATTKEFGLMTETEFTTKYPELRAVIDLNTH